MRIRRRCRGRSPAARGRHSIIGGWVQLERVICPETRSKDARRAFGWSALFCGGRMPEDIGGKPRTTRVTASDKLPEMLQVAAA
jgi:hypothetical protein